MDLQGLARWEDSLQGHGSLTSPSKISFILLMNFHQLFAGPNSNLGVYTVVGFEIYLYDTNWAQILGQSSPCLTPFTFNPPLVVLKVLSHCGMEQSGHYPVLTALRRLSVALCQRHFM